MILEHLDPSKIKTREWFMLELRSERTSEETIRRIGKELRVLFPSEPVEVFIPIKERDLSTFTLLTDCYVFVHADDVVKIGKLRRVTGVSGVLARDESTRPAKFIRVDDDYVQGLIKTCLEAHLQRSVGIGVGSWVRLIDGQMRDLCGYVLEMQGGRAVVKVAARTKMIVIETSVHNLIDLSDVPEAARVFYYSEPVTKFLEEHGEEAAEILAPDRNFSQKEMDEFLHQHEVEVTSVANTKGAQESAMSREQTPTRFIKSLIRGGEKDVHVLLRKTVEAIRLGHLKTPSTATGLWHILRETIRIDLFGQDPRVKTYSDVQKFHGRERWAITPKQVLELMPELTLRGSGGVATTVRVTSDPKEPVVHKRTVTGIVRASLNAGNRDMWTLIPVLEAALTDRTLRPPKHLESLVQAVRSQVLRYFRREHPDLDLKALADIYGQGLRVTILDLKERYPKFQALLDKRRAEAQSPLPIVSTEQIPIPDLPRTPKRSGVLPIKAMEESSCVMGIIPKPRRHQLPIISTPSTDIP